MCTVAPNTSLSIQLAHYCCLRFVSWLLVTACYQIVRYISSLQDVSMVSTVAISCRDDAIIVVSAVIAVSVAVTVDGSGCHSYYRN